jgi:hypothetical protein
VHIEQENSSELAKVTQVSDVAHGLLVQLYDGGHFLLVEESTQIYYTKYLGRDHRASASKLTNFLTQSHRYEQDSNQRGMEIRGLVI